MSEDNNNSKGLVAWFVTNHVAANILMIFIIITGAMSVSFMIREIFPSIDPRTINITVPFPGSTAQDVEDGITRRVEEALIGIQGIEKVESNASEGVGVVIAEIEDFVDSNEVLSDVETAVNSINSFPPEQAEEVTIVKAKPIGAVISIVVYGNLEEKTLRDWTELIEDGILQLPSVSLTSITGSREREISIEISEEKLRKYDLSIQDVARQVGSFSLNLPGGTFKTQGAEILMRVKDKRYYGHEFEDIIIKSNIDGSLLKLADIAEIRDGFEDKKFINTFEGQRAMFIDIKRSSSQDTIKIEEEVRQYLESLELPTGVSVSIWKNNTDILKDRMNLLARNAILGLALVFIALILFLDLKLAFWTSIGIAISFFGGLMFAAAFGVTMNMISLFALIVVLGIVVDDAIVTGESIFTEQESGKKGLDATLSGVKRIMSPVTIGVFTTVAAFAPLLFSTGVLGQVLRPIPIIVIGILLTSLLEAFFILPAHLSYSKRWSIGLLANAREYVSTKLNIFIEVYVIPTAKKLLRFRYITIAVVFVVIFSALMMLKLGVIKFVFFPQIESDEITINLEMPVGTPFETTKKNIEKILLIGEKIRKDYDQSNIEQHGNGVFKNVSVTIGGTRSIDGGPHGDGGTSTASHLAQVDVQLVPSDRRSYGSSEIEKEWQKQVGEVPGARKVAFESSLVRAGEDINIELTHRDEQILEQAGKALKQELKNFEGVYEVVDTYELGKQEFIYELNNLGLASGLTPLDIGRYLRSAFYGQEVQRIQRGRNEIKVLVRYPEKQRESLATIDQMRIKLPTGQRLALSEVTNRKVERSLSSIKRVDGRRVVQVTGDVDERVITPDEVIDQVFQDTLPVLAKRYPGLSYTLAGQSQRQRKDLQVLSKNMTIAMLLIFVMLAGQLRSYAKPIVILLTVPLGIAGAIFGHILLGYGLSFISMFGMVALSGVVINDSVVLVDFYNKLIAKGLNALDAAIESLRRRFRPILLTTLTTSLGLLPMMLETSLQARFMIPMAVSLACGIIFASTFLIFFVPSLLLVIDDIKRKCKLA